MPYRSVVCNFEDELPIFVSVFYNIPRLFLSG